MKTWDCPKGSAEAAGPRFENPPAPKGISFRQVQAPLAQPQLPDALRGAPPAAPKVDVEALTVPATDLLAKTTHGTA